MRQFLVFSLFTLLAAPAFGQLVEDTNVRLTPNSLGYDFKLTIDQGPETGLDETSIWFDI